MEIHNKTKEQLIKELSKKNRRIAELEMVANERKEAEIELQSSNANLLALIESTNDATLISDRYALPVLWNKTYSRIIKETLGIDMIKGLQPHKHLKDEKAVAWWDDLHRRALSGESFRVEYAHDFGKDDIRHFEVSYNPIFENGKISGFSEFARDITARKRAEEALRNEKEFTETALNAQQDTFFLFEPATGRAIRWNQVFNDITGYTNEEISRMQAPDSYYSPEDLKRAAIFIEKVLETEIGKIELELICKDGRKVITEYNVAVIKDEAGSPKYIISIGRDITERKQTEEALQEAHDLLEKRVKERTLELFESNAALKVLLNQREQDKEEFENNILSNIKHLVMPYIFKLKNNRLNSEELSYLNIIESNLKEVISPFSQKLSSNYMDFTPREIRIANLIKDGAQDKDIMGILNISLDTVKTHRKNIRRKLGIHGKRINLRTKLLSLT
jgi:PAS domain S-box-containing protein